MKAFQRKLPRNVLVMILKKMMMQTFLQTGKVLCPIIMHFSVLSCLKLDNFFYSKKITWKGHRCIV
jgi:hypothetical protein